MNTVSERGMFAPLSQRTRPPASNTDIVQRARSMKLVEARLENGLVLVQAPAGFGKSFLMTSIFQVLRGGGSKNAAWLTPRTYEDVSALSAEIAEACELRHLPDRSPQALVETLRARDRPTVLFVDDCDASLGAREAVFLSQLLEGATPHLKLMLARRSRLVFPGLSDFLMRGMASCIGWRDLRLNQDDIVRLLPGMNASKWNAPIARFTQGWPAMVRLACLCLKNTDTDNDGAVTRFVSGADENVQRYIREDVLPSLGPAVRQLISMSGYLERVCPELLEAVTPGAEWPDQSDLADAKPLLRDTQDNNWLTFHPALAAVMRTGFDRLPQDRRVECHRLAARWFSAHDHLEEAVHHSVETADYSMAEACIQNAGSVRIFLRSGFPTLHRLLAQLPASIIRESSALQLCQAVVLGKQGKLEPAREMVEDVKEALASEREGLDILPEDVAHIDGLVSVYEDRISDAEILRGMQSDASAISPRDLWRIGWIANHLCIAHIVLGDFAEAESQGLKALNCYREQRVGYAQVFMLIHLSLISIDRGKPLSAMDFLSEAEGLIETTQPDDTHIRAILNVPLAQVHHAFGDKEKALVLVNDALDALREGEAWVDLFERAFVTRARIALASHNFEDALRTVDLAEQTASRRRLDRLRVFAGLLKIEVMARSGLNEAAQDAASSFDWLAERQWPAGAVHHVEGQKVTWREWNFSLLGMARIAWTQNRREDAIATLETLCQSAKSIDANLELAAARALQFCYYWHMKRPEDARTSFQLAIALATPQRLVSIFSDEGYPMAVAIRGILRRFGASSFSHASIEFTNSVLRKHVREEVVMSRGVRGARVEILLSDHEREILEHLVRGLSNKAIALEIDRTEATVKYHLRRIYGKFGVRSRTGAIILAKDLSIIS